ncbi:uncharacterized protein [Panulirus ornatus]|uniref:uncharacterized protein isoform X2 n=1 Tax=Panulirus ornatus TaxID=150431 RepID=UPI003A83B849
MPLPDPSSCHHCHIHAPIPARDLKRTHPLRSHFIEKDGVAPEPRGTEQSQSSFRKNVSFLYRKISRRNGNNTLRRNQTNVSIPIPPPLPTTRVVDDRPAVVVDSLPAQAFQPLGPVPVDGRGRHRRRGLAGLQAVLLVGAYALLLVLAVVIGVVLSQGGRQRAIRPLPPRPVFEGASLVTQQPVRISRPRAPAPPPRVVRLRPSNNSPRPLPTKEPDFDYYDSNQDITLVPNPVSAPPRSPPTSPPVSFRPQPAPAPQVPPPQSISQRRSPTSQARRTNVPLRNVDEDFQLQTEKPVRGRKEPEVKILKSWSHHNADGTFSWGYINADGSFKNETRGLDCVVRGVYGYVEKETGQQLSFPYESGNPCDPDAPDYYYDYDLNTMPGDEAAEVRSQPGSSGTTFRRQG